MTTPETNAIDKPAAVAAQGVHVAPEKAPAKKAASQKKGAPKGQKNAKGAKAKAAAKAKKATKPTAAKKAAAPRAESKGAKILEMIARAKGATLAEIMKATCWQGSQCAWVHLDRRQEAVTCPHFLYQTKLKFSARS